MFATEASERVLEAIDLRAFLRGALHFTGTCESCGAATFDDKVHHCIQAVLFSQRRTEDTQMRRFYA